MTDGLQKEEIELLFEECRSKLHEVEEDLLELTDGKTACSAEHVGRIFRAFHSVKGAAAYLHHDSLKQLSHMAEDVLSEVREARIELLPGHAEVLLSAVDRMREMVADGGHLSNVQFGGELAGLAAILQAQTDPPAVSPAAGGPAAQAPAQALSTARAANRRPPRLKVLVVEDDFTARVVLQGLLSQYGDCHIAVNGREAVEAFRAACSAGPGYDLICMDIHMPELNGTEAVRQIRGIEEDQKVLSSAGAKIFMTTSIRDIKAVTASFKALCDAYLFKPIDGEKLLDHLKSFGLIRST